MIKTKELWIYHPTKPWWWTPENQILADRVQEAFDERDRKAIEWALSAPSDKV